MKIHCKCCGMYLGDISQAKLHKEIKYLCSMCYLRMELAKQQFKSSDNPMANLLNIFEK